MGGGCARIPPEVAQYDYYPLHYYCRNKACTAEGLTVLLERCPEAAAQKDRVSGARECAARRRSSSVNGLVVCGGA